VNLKKQLADLQKSMRAIAEGAKASGRDLTDEEMDDLEAKAAEADTLKGKIERSEKSAALLKRIGGNASEAEPAQDEPAEKAAKSVGAHFIANLKGRSLREKGTILTPEYKAASDVQVVNGQAGGYAPLLLDRETQFVHEKRERLVVEDLLGSGTVSGNAITYPVFGALEGGTDWRSETGKMSQLHVGDPTWKTDALSEVSGFFKMTEDMAEDLDYIVSEINSTALYDLASRSEFSILNGDGTNQSLLGLRNRSGVQTHEQGTDTVADAIFKGIRRVQTASGFSADGILIHPLDYENLRLGKDDNQQYFGGGYFQGAYGNGAILQVPPIWGLRTVVSLAAPLGEPLVGAYRPAAKVFNKGGVRVESTNSDEDDFTHARITVRVRRRVGLQVKYPSAFVKVALKAATTQ